VKIILLVSALVLVVSGGCGDDLEQPPEVEVFSGEMEVRDLQENDPILATNVDTVVFTVEGNQYLLEHTTDNSGLCGSGGTVGNFGSNLIRLSLIFTISQGTCDTARVPKGEFKAAYPSNDSLVLGPDTIEYVVTVSHQEFRDSLCFTFRLVK
jgi:hypothetical protein